MTFSHDTMGNLLSTTRNDRKETFSYKTDGVNNAKRALMIGWKDANERATTYNYNNAELKITPQGKPVVVLPHSFITSIETPTGTVTFDIDVPNFLVSKVTDQNQHTTTYNLNKYGSPLSIVDPAGTTQMTWAQSDILMMSKTDARQVETRYDYDAAGNKISEITDGKTLEWNYLIQTEAPFIKDALKLHKDRNGNTRSYLLDNAGNVRVETLPEDVIIRHEYQLNGDRLNTTDGNSGLTTFTYDRHGNLETVTDPVGAKTTTLHNERGHVKQTTDPLGNTTLFELDKQDRVHIQTDTLGGKRVYTYDEVGNKLTETDETNATTTWTYKKHNLPETITRAGGTKVLTYDGVGNKKSETDFRGHETTFDYDGANRLVLRTEPLGKTTEYGYDEVGNVTSETDALKRVTKHEYNLLGQRFKTIDAAKGVWLIGHDGNGNKTSSTDPLLRETTFTYDGLNRLTAEKAPLGATTSYKYDKNNNVVLKTDPNGHATGFVFDKANRNIEVVHADQTKTLNGYDKNDNLVKVTDPNLNVTQFSYDVLNRKKSMTDGEGYVTLYGYDGAGNLTREELPNGNVVTHTYNELDLRTSTKDHLGDVGGWDYDTDGNKTLEIDANGNRTTHIYNALGQLTDTALPEERALVFVSDLMGNRTSARDAKLKTTTYKYDELNRQIESKDALENVTLTGYDPVGNKVSEIDPLKRETVTKYDDLNRPIKVIDALKQEVAFGYDLKGNKTSEINKRKVLTKYVYDNMDRVKSVTKDGLLLSTTTYADNGNVQSSTDANGNITSFAYDKRNLRTQEARLLAAITNFKLDSMGDVVVATDPESRTTTNTYDKRRRMITQRNFAGEETAFGYDGVGNRTKTTRPSKAETNVVYDGANRIKSITDPVGTTTYGYDKNSNHTLVIDAEKNETGYVYDELNRRTEINYPGGAKETFTYDANSNMKTHVDGNGVTITYGYDELDREKLKSFSASADGLVSIATAYDENNNVKTVTQTGATVQVNTYSYDNFDREEVSKDAFNASATKNYDANGNKTALITQDGTVTKYTYDALNRLKTMVSQSGNMSYAYDRSSLNTKTTYGNGVTSTTTYDDAKRVKTVLHNRGTKNLSRTEYEYDANGNRKKETINRTGGAQVTTYDYDTADRLTTTDVTDAGKKVTSVYGYDAVANRKIETVTTVIGAVTDKVTKEYKYDGRNQLRQIVDSKAGVTDLDYDNQGNLTQKTVGNDLTKYTYNARDNLMGVSRNSTVLGRYFSDHRGLRVEKEAKDRLNPDAPPVRLRTLWDGRNAFQDSTIGGVVTMRYENDGRHPVSMWSKDDGVQALHSDALGSIVATTDTTGELKSETLFDAWGNVQMQTGQSATKFGYTGHQMDHETGLIYFQARYYDPEIGRFITQDPYEGDWKTPLSLNHYLYAYANPTTYIDLDGYEAMDRFVEQHRKDMEAGRGDIYKPFHKPVVVATGVMLVGPVVAPFALETGAAGITIVKAVGTSGLRVGVGSSAAEVAVLGDAAVVVAEVTAGTTVGGRVASMRAPSKQSTQTVAAEAKAAHGMALGAEQKIVPPKPVVNNAPGTPSNVVAKNSGTTTVESSKTSGVRAAKKKSENAKSAPGSARAELSEATESTSYTTPYRPLSQDDRRMLKGKIDARTTTKEEYKNLEWDRRFANRRNRGVDRFWSKERKALKAGEQGTRNWSDEQREAILNGKTPKYNGQPIKGHHKENALDHPHIADKAENIYPATDPEHLYRWHGGNYQNDTKGVPLDPSFKEEF